MIKTLLRIRPITVLMLFAVSCLCISCSHLNVDFDSSWSTRDISIVVVEHEQAPDDVTTSDIVNILTRSGWSVVDDINLAQARVVCRWVRQPDLTVESEPIEVVKSFHVQVISVERPKILAVSDYFYSNNSEALLDGVNAALIAITTNSVEMAPQPVASEVHPAVASEVQPAAISDAIVKPTSAPVVKVSPVEQVNSQGAAVEQFVSAPQPVVQPLNNEKSAIVGEFPSVPTELTPPAQHVLPLESVKSVESIEPVSMETSPWVPRFQGMGLDEWGKQ